MVKKSKEKDNEKKNAESGIRLRDLGALVDGFRSSHFF